MPYKNEGKPLTPLIAHTGKLLNDRLREELAAYNIHFGQSRVLLALHEHGELTQASIGKGLHIKSSTVTNMLKKMDVSGLVRRVPDRRDERILNVSLTEEGQEAVLQVIEVMANVEKDILAGLAGIGIGMEDIRIPLETIRNSLGGRDPEI